MKYYSPITNLCIIRVAREHHSIAWAAVTLIRKLQGKAYIPHVIHVSGTMKHAQLAAIIHNRESVAVLRVQAKLPGKHALMFQNYISSHTTTYSIAMYQSKYDEYLETSTKEIESLRD